MDRVPPAQDSNGPTWWSERAEIEAGLLRTEPLVAKKYGLATIHVDSLTPSIEDSGTNPAAFSCSALIYDDMCQPTPTPGIVAIETAVTNSSQCAAPQRCPWPAGGVLRDGMFWDERGRGLTPVGPRADTATIRTALNTTRVDLGSFSSRCGVFRRTHTSTDPIWLLCIRLALPLTLPLPSGFMSSARLVVCTSPRALWLVCYFSWVCIFWDERGGGLTPVGPQVNTATIRIVLSTNRVDLASFSSRCCTFRRTHTSADSIRLLCIRLALPLTFSLPSRFAPSARLVVCASPRALDYGVCVMFRVFVYFGTRGEEDLHRPVQWVQRWVQQPLEQY